MKKHIFIFVGVIVIAAVITFVAFKSLDSENAQRDPKFEQIPPIISKIKTLEVVNAKLMGAGTLDAIVEIEIKNNSPKPIIAVAIESGDKKEASGNSRNGFKEGDAPPDIVVKPFEIFTMHMPLANVRPGYPIRIGG